MAATGPTGRRSMTSPEVGKSMAPARLSSVDLPQPLRPASATNSPRATSSETPTRAGVPE
jgi:hypothetical protein